MLKKDQSVTFEKAMWQVKYRGVEVKVCAIYHPLYSETYQVINNQFIDEFSEYIAEQLAEHRNLVITGDFNLYVNNPLGPRWRSFHRHYAYIGIRSACNIPYLQK